MADENPLLRKAVSLDGSEAAIKEFYAEWSKNYDADLLNDIGYVGPQVAAIALAKRISGSAQVLDAGCGTGLVAVELEKRAPGVVIDGIDLTAEMLEQAREKGLYRALDLADMTAGLPDIADDSYDAVVCAGVFTNGHVGPVGIPPLLRVAKPSASVVLTVRDSAWEADGFKDKVEALQSDGAAKVVEVTHSPYHTKENVFCQLVVLEAL